MWTRRSVLATLPGGALAACGAHSTASGGSAWTRLTSAAAFPGAYGFPVHVARDGRFVALHPRGTWSSHDALSWTREPLPQAGINHAYHAVVQHRGAAWSLATVTGNYLNFAIDPVVRRTDDYRSWQTVGRSRRLPPLIFATVASLRGSLWLIGGFDGTRYSNAIWRSHDGLAWERAGETPWPARSGGHWFVFRDRWWIIGGGVIDGPIISEVWSSADGLTWRRDAERLAEPPPFGFSPIVFDDRIWLLGANRSGAFTSELLVSADGRTWSPQRAPWSPRGAPAVWTDGARLYLTGGKYSRPGPGGEPQFIYYNDVWAMTA